MVDSKTFLNEHHDFKLTPIFFQFFSTKVTTTSSVVEEGDEEELPATSRPAVPAPQPRRPGVKTPTGTKTRATQAPAIVRETTTEAALIEEEPDEIPEAKKPAVSGRKVVTRVSPRIVNTETTTQPAPTAAPRRPISKTRIDSTTVPKPMSFTRSKTSQPKQREQPIETTTLEPIPVPAFEPTRRSAQKPIIQSITVDNEEDSESEQLPRKKTIRRRKVVKRIYSSDLAKFSSRVRFAERAAAGPIKFSSYSPPLVNPNDESFIEINRIK